MTAQNNESCIGCHYGKETRKPFNKKNQRPATACLDRIHTDILHVEVESLAGHRYVLTFIDEWSRFAILFFLATRDKETVNEKWLTYKAYAQRLHQRKIKELRCDRGGEYINEELLTDTKKDGITVSVTQAYSSEQNGIAERYNRTLMNGTRAQQHHSDIPLPVWGEICAATNYQRQRTPSRALDWKTPYERWYQAKPDISHMRIIWSQAFMHIPKAHRSHRKLSARAAGPFRLVGYSDTKQLTYRLYDEEDGRVYESRDVTFHEGNHKTSTKAILAAAMSDSDTIDAESSDQTSYEDDADHYVAEKIVTHRLNAFGELEFLVKWEGYADSDNTWQSFEDVNTSAALEAYLKRTPEVNSTDVYEDMEEPKTFAQAKRSKQRPQWQTAMERELQSHKENDTWTEVYHLPEGAYVVDTKWIYKIKRHQDGTIKKFKARLVARGFTQRPGIDYDETHAPVVKFTSMRTMLAIAAYHDMEIHQMDVVTAFLNSDIDTDIYIKLEDDTGKVKYAKLNKSLYGLKQAPRLWNQTIDSYLQTLGFEPSPYDVAFYLRFDTKGELNGMISLYVDDLTICTKNPRDMDQIKQALHQRFKMEDMGELSYLLGIEITRDRKTRTLSLSQTKYVDDIINRFKLNNTPGISTPLDTSINLFDNELEEEADTSTYQSMVGSLMYLMMGTRPDLAYPVSKLSQFLAKPRRSHLEAAIRTLRYVKSTRNHKLTYGRPSNLELVGYSDADYAKDIQTRRSTSGYVFLLNSAAISWKSQRQRTTALSTAEAEYMALAEAVKEAVWLRNFVHSILKRGEKPPTPITIREDNKAAIDIANNPVDHQRTKHIDIRYHFTREKVKSGDIVLEHCTSERMLADFLTKPFPKPRNDLLSQRCGLLFDSVDSRAKSTLTKT